MQHLTPLRTLLARWSRPSRPAAVSRRRGGSTPIRAATLEAGSLIIAKEAERRVLLLQNPGCAASRKIMHLPSTPACRWAPPCQVAPRIGTRRACRGPRSTATCAHTAVNAEAHDDARRGLHHHAADGAAPRRQRSRTSRSWRLDGLDIPRRSPRCAVLRTPRGRRGAACRGRPETPRPVRLEPPARGGWTSATARRWSSTILTREPARRRPTPAAPVLGWNPHHGLKMRNSILLSRCYRADHYRGVRRAAAEGSTDARTARPTGRASAFQGPPGRLDRRMTCPTTGSRVTSSWCELEVVADEGDDDAALLSFWR